ncbi:hypothetical protein FKW77_009399 [Venturia effusa]|uniref:Uncharacterized protein n=1 Tax=Venturia effusa TaxID=50376 RepID=A0A517LEL0_9PEZI|nr:hypothetical protein FKW77_009399 [Venturia effusa]
MSTSIPSTERSRPQISSRKRNNSPEFPPVRAGEAGPPPNRPLPALPPRRGQQDQPRLLHQSQEQGLRNDSPSQYPLSQYLLSNHPSSSAVQPSQQFQGRHHWRNPCLRKPVPAASPPTSLRDEAYLNDKQLPPLPRFDAITMSPSPTREGANDGARGRPGRSGGNKTVAMDLLAPGQVSNDDVIRDNGSKEIAREAIGSGYRTSSSSTLIDETSSDPSAAHSLGHLRNRAKVLMTHHSGAQGPVKQSFDDRMERDLSTRVKPRPPPMPTNMIAGVYRTSRFKEELVISEEDVADFERWKEMKRMDEQRYDATRTTDSTDPRSPLEVPAMPMRNINDSVPRRFLRKFSSFGSRRNSKEGEEPAPWKRQSSSSLLHKVTSLKCVSFGKIDEEAEPILRSRPTKNSLADDPNLIRTTEDLPSVRPQRQARSPLDLHVGRMVFEDDNPFAYIECQAPVDAFHGLKRWSWYNKPEGRSFDIDPDWDKAKKELGHVDVADDQVLSIIADYEDMPEYGGSIRDIESSVAATEEKLGKDHGTTSPRLGIGLSKAPPVLGHLKLYGDNLLKPMFEPRALSSLGSKDEFDVPLMLEEISSGDSHEGNGGRSFDCAAALNGQMTFLISDSDDDGVEEQAVIGAYEGHGRYLSGEVVRVCGMDGIEGAFF